ncbi:MAG: hypothetical protein M3N08_07850 [Pseudomonadota bacterium]|nr:hypothetical protein [Pseudomonadota bacterium]
MNRRRFIGLISGALAADLVITPVSWAGEAGNRAPYGAPSIDKLVLRKLEESLRDQLASAGMTPKFFDLFPKKYKQQAAVDPRADSVTGEPEKNSAMDSMPATLTKLFQNYDQATCGSFGLQNSFNAWRAFVALHETAHYVALHTKIDGYNDLNHYVFNKVNKVEGLDDSLYRSAPTLVPKDVPSFVAQQILTNLPERIADASAALYILSNCADPAKNQSFLEDITDFRRAAYLGGDALAGIQSGTWVSSWGRHNTASSLQTALKNFRHDGRPGMTIVETTELAARLVVAQPEFSKSLDAIARDLQAEMAVKGALFYGEGNRASRSLAARRSESERRQQFELTRDIVAARDRSCGMTPGPWLDPVAEAARPSTIMGPAQGSLFRQPQP